MRLEKEMLDDITSHCMPVANLNVDSAYQRCVIPTQVKKIATNFLPEALGALICGERSDGSCWIVDGLQRHSALLEMGIDTVSVVRFPSGGRQHEARVFQAINCDRTGVHALTRFHATVTAGLETSVGLLECVEDYGFRIPRTISRKWPNVTAITPLRKLYEQSPERVDWVLDVLCRAFSNRESTRTDALSSFFLGMLCELSGYADELDKERVVSLMSQMAIKPFLAEVPNASGGGRAKNAANHFILSHYNKRLSKNKVGTLV